jgi:hypothetical protein
VLAVQIGDETSRPAVFDGDETVSMAHISAG